MIFFGQAQKCMWMKTPTALSVAFIDQDRTIVQIDHLQPFSTDSVCSKKELLCNEMNKDWFEVNGLKEGSQVKLN